MKRFLSLSFAFVTVALLLLACNNADKTASSAGDTNSQPTFDLTAAKKAIEAVNAEFGALVAKGDSVSVASLYTIDAKLMGSNMPAVSGRSGIQSAFSGMFSAMGPIGLALTTTDVWGTESLVSEEGTFTMSDKDGKQIDKGKYIVLWKMEDGKWKLYRDCWNSDNPPPPAK